VGKLNHAFPGVRSAQRTGIGFSGGGWRGIGGMVSTNTDSAL
jgi:hypothetical protein